MRVKGWIVILLIAVISAGAYFILAESFKSGDISRSMEFEYSVKVINIPKDARNVSVLIPVPQTDPHQVVANVKIESPYTFTHLTDNEYGNKVVKIDLADDAPESFEVKMIVSVNRKRYTALDGSMKGIDSPSDDLRQRLLAADRLIPLDGPVMVEQAKVVRDEMSDLQKARVIYNYLVESMKYDKSGDGWGRGDAVYACDSRSGNCTDFHSLFIGMARVSGIPARFVMGFPVPADKEEGEIGGYHCWAEFYTDELGWVPVDASEANKHPDKREFFFGSLDQNRIAFTYGRDIDFGIEELSEPLNYLIYPLVLVDGNIHSDFEKKFAFSNREIDRII
ncbi:MAG: transglutaminase domain-containing protein [candidate division Zixibacteria bacterium]